MIKTDVKDKKINDSLREVFELGKEYGNLEFYISDYVSTHEEHQTCLNRQSEIKFRVNSILSVLAS
jgi:hypothetical protein